MYLSRISQTEGAKPKRPNTGSDWLTFEEEFNLAVGELGLKPHEFWALTYAEFLAMVEGYKRVREREQKNRIKELIYLAWHTAAFSREERLPALDSLINDSAEPKREQTDDEMMAMCRILNAAFGGKVVEVYGD